MTTVHEWMIAWIRSHRDQFIWDDPAQPLQLIDQMVDEAVALFPEAEPEEVEEATVEAMKAA